MRNWSARVFRGEAGLLLAGLSGVNLVVWSLAFAAFSDRPSLLASALLAWMFGLRHAVDADHIAAIDNVVRKLMQQGQKPYAVGLHFSLGHSTVVIVAAAALALTASFAQHALDSSAFESFKTVGGAIGTSVSATFLLLIAAANLVILKGVWRAFRAARAGAPVCEQSLDLLLSGRGFLARLFRPAFAWVDSSWKMYPLGFLFGLGFDTATEIGVLALSASQATHGLTFTETMLFPALFTAGMTLVDTADSSLMVGAYGWAFVKPLRKLWYNLTLTAASVAVALFIGGVEALGLIAEKLGLEGAGWGFIGQLNDNLGALGFVVIGLFALVWIGSMAIYRARGYDNLSREAV
ncbi:HoxN/HupN/NixA family nickel/cobalt transporter [Rhodoblastus sphagnicola]|uniref:Nickel/cobalt efflux system n=1 Tax=Rhodoblastus sphagnicola TaxID=333368 RepID=A0A2S6N9V9_9HYPH|nr:HoxN/HupN/NixA family nickel/cobalt transporter [Rhodoblastus sphagnicola]MBB4198765.1 high-affinity nickel-transport protein [Rhodoblastus sphagnicola]PPQ31400.1 HoxN/HupN/NixA family nickel/cobalt transporter [Rhodoblastus sphagnicola]